MRPPQGDENHGEIRSFGICPGEPVARLRLHLVLQHDPSGSSSATDGRSRDSRPRRLGRRHDAADHDHHDNDGALASLRLGAGEARVSHRPHDRPAVVDLLWEASGAGPQ